MKLALIFLILRQNWVEKTEEFAKYQMAVKTGRQIQVHLVPKLIQIPLYTHYAARVQTKRKTNEQV